MHEEYHASEHENSGEDEISVAGLSGELADAQPPKTHNLGGSEHGSDTLANLITKVSDVTAFFTNIAGEIAGVTEKTTVTSSDILLIEDQADGNNKKKTLISTLKTFFRTLTESLSSDHTWSGDVVTFTAGENLVFGELCYMKSDGKNWKSDANAVATMPGMYLALGTINADASGTFLRTGFARDDTWAWTVGGILYASGTPGAMTQTAPSATGDQVQVVGIATHADRIDFRTGLSLVEVSA